MKKHFIIITLLLGIIPSINSQSYKIMTYNIRYDNPNDGENQWSKRKEYLCSQILFYSPDVFGIQEGLNHQVAYINDSFKNYNYVGIGRDDGKEKGEYCAIFYNSKKLKALKNDTFWLSETPSEISVGWDASMERICTYVLLKDKKSKQKFWVFNAHFDHIGDQARLKSVELILNKIEAINTNNFPIILMGDFNLLPKTKAIQQLSAAMKDSKNNSEIKPFGSIGTFNGFHFNEPVNKRIDYIFTSKNNVKILKYAVLSDSKDLKYPSDHLPVYVVIKL